MVIACTGHRPNKLDNDYSYTSDLSKRIMHEMRSFLLRDGSVSSIISGLAVGIDTMWAMVGFELGIPVIGAIPFEGQENRWPDRTKELYYRLLIKCTQKVYVSEPGYTASKMQIRNQWMVDNSDLLFAVYNGDQFGGTYNCIQYALSKQKPVVYLNPKDLIIPSPM